MYQATLDPVSNRADWIGTFELIDDETGDVVTDLTGVELTLEVRERLTCTALLSATIANGKVIDAGGGILEWTFPRSEMTGICPGSYELGATITRDDTTDQLLIGIIPIVSGVVSR